MTNDLLPLSDDLAAEIAGRLAGQGRHFALDEWAIHGACLALHTDHAEVRALAQRLLRPFRPPAGPPLARLRLCLTTGEAWALPPDAEILPPSSNEIIDLQASYGLTSRFGRRGSVNYLELWPMAGAAYDLSSGEALAYLRQPEAYRPWLIQHLFLMTLVLEMLRGRGLYWVHAAAVADAGRAALIIGQTGAGKTTTSLALVGGGFQFLSEDRVFVRAAEAGVEVLSFAEDVAVTAHTIQLLPWLADRLGDRRPARVKLEFDPASLFPQSLVESARPGLILFPRVRPEGPAEARPMSAAAALQRMLPNSLLASQPEVSARHFEALARLAEQSRTYELSLGADPGALAGLVRGLFAA